jgi:muramoyltetrapeptide carboxypeptidase
VKRRNFIKTISTATVVAAVTKPAFAQDVNAAGKKLRKPTRLKIGDTIALVTPGSYITKQEKDTAVSNLRSLGFNVTYSERLMQKNGYFSATDKERAADINEMFGRKDVHGIICARGGYGCARILPYLDFELIRKNPKPFIGFSDVTAIHYAVYKYSNLVTFDGIVASSDLSQFSKNCFKKVLLEPSDKLLLENSKSQNNYNPYGISIISEGRAEGELIGGNLSIVTSMIGTKYDVDFSGKIIFLEEFIEEPYRIDRMLTQMLQAGKFKDVAGIALGVFKLCEPSKTNPAFIGSFSLMEVLKDRLGNLGVPVIYGLSFGHIADKFTLPVGITAELSTEAKQLKLLEAGVL